MMADYSKSFNLRTRRTIRRYCPDKPVTEAMLRDILEDAIMAPTTGNMQLYSIIVTRDEEAKKRLAPAHFNQPQVEGSQVVLTVCADTNRFVSWCEARGAEPGFDNAQMLTCAILDAAIVAQQIVTAAEMRGLGTCYLGTTTYNAPQIAEALNLPKRVLPLITITLGWPDDGAPYVGRLPLEAVVCKEQYEPNTPERINQMYAEKEARPDSRQFMAENGLPSLAHVFAQVRYPKDSNDHFSQVLVDFLKSQLFIP